MWVGKEDEGAKQLCLPLPFSALSNLGVFMVLVLTTFVLVEVSPANQKYNIPMKIFVSQMA